MLQNIDTRDEPMAIGSESVLVGMGNIGGESEPDECGLGGCPPWFLSQSRELSCRNSCTMNSDRG